MIEKIKLINYRGFESLEIPFNSGRNILVGENGVGKSSILTAISYVLSGSFASVEKIGFQSLFNVSAIEKFLNSEREFKELPHLIIELYFTNCADPDNFNLKGRQNTDKKDAFGLQMMISPNDDYSKEIKEALEKSASFPFDYYKLEFNTFSGSGYNSYNRKHKVKYESIDTASINSTFAIKNYITRLYENQTDKKIRQKINHDFRENTDEFSKKLYTEYGLEDSSEYEIRIRSSNEANFHEKITAQKDCVDIADFGHGEKVLLGMKSSLESSDDEIQIVLIEEPENHLSFLNMHKLIEMIERNSEKQTFIATHSNMIASRLDLSNAILLSESSFSKLSDLKNDTSKFFQKAPNTNILNFVLSKKAILVEGDAEYIILEEFYKQISKIETYKNDIALISCGGKTFERYLQVAELLQKKVAVITDNDKDYALNIEGKYSTYEGDNIKVFADQNNENYTFEVCMYKSNEKFYEDNIKKPQMKNGVLSYMLDNKAEASFRLLNLTKTTEYKKDFKIPQYIKDAILWINK